MLPHELPAWGTVYSYFSRWRAQGIWDQALDALRMKVRIKDGRDPEPGAAVIDSQSIKTSAVRGPEKGYDAGKKNLGTQADRVVR
jgi:transposase